MTSENKGRTGARRELAASQRGVRKPKARQLPPDALGNRDDLVALMTRILEHVYEGTLEGIGPTLDSTLALRIWKRDRRPYRSILSAMLHVLPARYARGFLNHMQTPELRREAMAIAERIERKGRRQGRTEGRAERREVGREEGRIDAKQGLLERHLDRKFGLTERQRNTIRAQRDPQRLDAALDAILFADSKEAVLALLKQPSRRGAGPRAPGAHSRRANAML